MNDETKKELQKRIPVAEYIASNAGSLITDLFHKTIRTQQKTPNDYVTELDKSIESMAIKAFQQQFPDDGFYGEEGIGIDSKNDFEWVVDPIDGTNNYVRGLPLCGFQLAILYKDNPVYGLIHRPLTQEIYAAQKGEGAKYKNNLTGESKELSVSNRSLPEAFGIFDSHVGKSSNGSTKLMLKLADVIGSIRVLGAAVFDLPAVAEGSVEFLISGIGQKYDLAAGQLLIEEAGGHSYNIRGEEINLEDGLVVFSNNTIRTSLLEALSNRDSS